MEDYQIRQLGLILAQFTEVLGMQAENMQRSVLGDSMAYTGEDFNNAAQNIVSYANQLR